jgi:hypothetical protein
MIIENYFCSRVEIKTHGWNISLNQHYISRSVVDKFTGIRRNSKGIVDSNETYVATQRELSPGLTQMQIMMMLLQWLQF